MNRNYCALFIVVLTAFPVNSNAQTLAALPFATGGLPPWTTQTDDRPGIFNEVVREALATSKTATELQFTTWRDAEQMLSDGEVFAVFPVMSEPGKSKAFPLSDPVMLSVTRIYFNPALIPKPPEFERLSDLQPFHMVGAFGRWYQQEFRLAGFKIDYVNTRLQQLILIATGRFELAPLDQVVADMLIAHHFPGNEAVFDTLQKPLREETLHLRVSRKFPNTEAYLDKFNQGLATIKSNGSYRDILLRYGVSLGEDYQKFIKQGGAGIDLTE